MRSLRMMIALFVCAALFSAGVVTAENDAPRPPEFPAYTQGDNVVTYFFEIFVEGRKVGFGKWSLSKVKVGEKDMLLVERETDFVTGEGAQTGTERSRALADAESMQLLFAEGTAKNEGLERFGFVECARAGNEVTLKYYNRVNDKTHFREEKQTTDRIIYPDDLVLYAYAQLHLNAESRAQEQRLFSVPPLKASIDDTEIEFLEIEKANVFGKELPLGSIKTEGYKKLLIDIHGAIVESLSSDGVKAIRLSNAQNYKKTPVKLDKYEMPAFLKDNTAEWKDFGISISRPDDAWTFSFSTDMPIFNLNRLNNEGCGNIMGMAFPALPKGASAADISARLAEMIKLAPDSKVTFGDPQEIEANGMKGIEGDFDIVLHADVVKGRYRAFVKDGRGVCIMLAAHDSLWKDAKGGLEKIASSLKFLEGEKQEGDPVMKEPKLGVELAVPGESWRFEEKKEKDSITAKSAWNIGSLYFGSFAKSPELTLNMLRDNAKQGLPNHPADSKLKDIKDTKICDFDALVAEYDYTDKLTRGPAISIWVVYILRNDTVAVISFGGLTLYRDQLNADLEKILKQIKLTEPVKEEEKPVEDEIY